MIDKHLGGPDNVQL